MAEGYVMTIPKKVLEQLTKADDKINQISESSKKAASVVEQSFKSMTSSLAPFVDQLNRAKEGMKSLVPKTGSKDIGKLADNIAAVSVGLNKVSESPVDIINKKIESLKNLLNDSQSAVTKLNTQLSTLKATGSGQISMTTIKGGNTSTALSSNIQAEIKVLEQQKRSILDTQNAWNEYVGTINGTSLAALRQQAAMEKLNSSFRTGNSALQQRQKMMDDAFNAAYRTAEAEEKLAKKQDELNKKRASASETRAATQAESAYNRAMMATEGTMTQRINKIAKLKQAQDQLSATGKNYSTQLTKIAVETERLQKANLTASNATDKLKQSQSRVLDTTAQLQRKLALLFSVAAIQGYISKLVQVRGEFEIQQRSLQAILQNKDQADALFEKIVSLAIKSPYTIKELITYTKQLAAYRIETEKLYDTTKMLADISSGLGVDMNRLILAFGQVKAANYLRGQELRQFSEAGVNILGELATYFTELEGRMVSVGEVFEMVSKRMVSFGDVENIFKKLTSAGGIFYNMQEIQAETLQGQLSNLEDSFDVMFNAIGKANDGVLKDMVSATQKVVENWEILAGVLKTSVTVWTLYAAKTLIAAAANRAFAASSLEATMSQKGLIGMLGNTFNMLSKAGSFLKANPWLIIAGVAVGAYEIYSTLNSKLQDTRETYDILTRSIDTNIQKSEQLVDKIKEQKQIQEDADESLSKYGKGTKEYAAAEERSNKAKKELAKLLNQLKVQFPEIYSSLGTQKDKIDELTNATKKYNNELRQTQILNELMKESPSLFSSSFKEDAINFSQSINEKEKAIEELSAAYDVNYSKITRILQTDDAFASRYKSQFEQIDKSNMTSIEKFEALYKLVRTARQYDKDIPKELKDIEFVDKYSKYVQSIKDFKDYTTSMEKQYQILEDNALKAAKITKSQFASLNEEQKKAYAKSIVDFVNSAAGYEDIAVQTFIKKRLKSTFNIDVSFDKKQIQQEFTDIQKEINAEIAKINKDTGTHLKPIAVDEQPIQYMDELLKRAKELKDEAEQARRATSSLYTGKTNTEAASQLEKQATAVEKLARAYGASTMGDTSKGESAYERRMKSQLDFLKKLNKEYEKLRQIQGKEEATKTITDSFGKSYEKLFGKPLKIEFDKASIIAEMQSIANTIGGKSADALMRGWDLAISELTANINVSVVEQNISDFERRIENMFSGYEVYIELKAQGLDNDLIKDIFKIDTTSLDDIKKALEDVYPDPSILGEKQLSSYYKISKQIANAEQKELNTRLKEYTKYLKKSSSERLRIKLEELRQLNAVDKIEEYTPEQKETVKQSIKKETTKKIQKQEWDEFKNSEMYTQMFKDLETMGAQSIVTLKEKLEELKGSLTDLPVTDVKEIMGQIEKLENLQIKANPFASLRDAMKEVNALQKEGKTEESLQLTLQQAEQQRATAQKELDAIDLILNARQENILLESMGIQWQQQYVDLLGMGTDELNQQRNAQQAIVNNSKITSANANKDLSSYAKARKSLNYVSQEWDSIRQISSQAFDSIKTILTSMGVESDSTAMVLADMGGSLIDLVAQAVLFGAQLKLMTLQAEILGKNINSALGPIGWAVMALQGIATIFSAIFSISDKRREREIEKEKEKVEALEQAYEKLEKTIENGLSIDVYSKNADKIKLLQQQVQSYYSMIKSEQGKKDPSDDAIKGWRNDIADINAQIEDLFNGVKEQLLGTFKDISNQLGDAITNAFAEGTDAAKAWGDTVHDIMSDILKNLIIQKFIEPKVQEWFDKYYAALMPATSDAEAAHQRYLEAQAKIDYADKELKGNADFIFGMFGNSYKELKAKAQKAYDEWMAAEEAAKGEVPNLDEEVSKNFAEGLENIFDSINGQIPEWLKEYLGQNAGATELDTLNKGIQGVTETTAAALEALLNSMRFFVASSNEEIIKISSYLSPDPETNPLLSELKTQTALIRSIDSLLSSVTKAGHSQGGMAIKVIMS